MNAVQSGSKCFQRSSVCMLHVDVVEVIIGTMGPTNGAIAAVAQQWRPDAFVRSPRPRCVPSPNLDLGLDQEQMGH